MTRRNFLKILGLSSAAVTFGRFSLPLTAEQARDDVAIGDSFAVQWQSGFRAMQGGPGVHYPVYSARTYIVKAIRGEEIDYDVYRWDEGRNTLPGDLESVRTIMMPLPKKPAVA